MTITLSLTPELEQRLTQEANRQGLSAGTCAMRLLDKHLPHQDRNEALVALLQSWMDEDDAS